MQDLASLDEDDHEVFGGSGHNWEHSHQEHHWYYITL